MYWKKAKVCAFCFMLMLLIALAACSQAEPQVVEVTRVVTETVVETVEAEGSEAVVEVTRVVVETVVVEVVPEAPAEEQQTQPADAPYSRGSEGDAIPLPTPATGPKVGDDASPLAAGTTNEGLRVGTAVDIPLVESSRLAAGVVNDNENWADYLAYLQAYPAADIITLDVSERHIIQLLDAVGQPIPGALVQITANGELVTALRTHSNGSVLFFPRIYDLPAGTYLATAVYGEQSVSIPLTTGGVGDGWQLVFDEEREAATAVPLDILFLIDATGSMDDEIRQLKDNMVAIAMQINTLPTQPNVRFGLVTYRDRTDDAPLHIHPFTAELESFVAALAAIEAQGGGDYPEDLHAGLFSAIRAMDWQQEGSVPLIFLIGDAPPHLDYPDQDDYTIHLRQAMAQGIKIYPIASSGLDTQGEYIFRQLAQMTDGRFIFLTPENTAAPNDEPTFAVANYTVADLDDLIVQIVTEELAPLNP